MSTMKIVAFLLIAAGIISLLYGWFSYTRENHEANLGLLEISIQEKSAVNALSGQEWWRFSSAELFCSRLTGKHGFAVLAFNSGDCH